MTGPELLALLPVLVLVFGATGLLMFAPLADNRPWPLAAGTLTALAAALCAALYSPLTVEAGGLIATGPYARYFTGLWALTAAGTLSLSHRYVAVRRLPGGEYSALVLFAAAGMALLSGSSSLAGIFLALEAFSLAFYILIAFNRRCPLGGEAGLKYLVPGAVATGLLAFGIALIYATGGTLHLPEALSGFPGTASLQPIALAGWALLLAAFGFKLSLVPFHFWTPDVYQGAPAPVTGLLATGSKGAVFAALLTLSAALPAVPTALMPILWALAALSMVVGSFSALGQSNVKRMLAYSSVAHMGLLLTALLCWNAAGRSAGLFYLAAYSIATLGAFGALTALADGQERQKLVELRGLGRSRPLAAAVLTVCLLALAGLPPTGGFVGKLTVFSAAFEAGYAGLALIGIATSILSIYFYLQPIIAMYMNPIEETTISAGAAGERIVLTLCLFLTLALGILPGPLLDLIARIIR
jgi:NADH-quinone oxidoreductase subunit N